MLYLGEDYNQPLRAHSSFYFLLILLYLSVPLNTIALPAPMEADYNLVTENSASETNETSTDSDLYVIRAIVYEIGVLTDNVTDENKERHEEVNISFYNPPHKDNGFLELGNVTAPETTTNFS